MVFLPYGDREESLAIDSWLLDLSMGCKLKDGIYPDIDPFLEETEEERKTNDDWDHLLDFNIDDIPLLGKEGLLPFVCKMGKSSRNKKRGMENLNFFYQDIRTSSSARGHLTQEEAAKDAISITGAQKVCFLEEESL
ncbi:hypothetical protein Tco_0829501 [Tanacetum coccineum]